MQNATTTIETFTPTPHQAQVIARALHHGFVIIRHFARNAVDGPPYTNPILAIEEVADDLHNAPGLLTGAHPKQWGAELYDRIVKFDPFQGADMTAAFEEVNRRNAQAALDFKPEPVRVSEKVVADRLRRRLARQGLRLRKAGRRDFAMGPYYAVNDSNVVERSNIDPAEHGCIRPGEVMA